MNIVENDQVMRMIEGSNGASVSELESARKQLEKHFPLLKWETQPNQSAIAYRAHPDQTHSFVVFLMRRRANKAHFGMVPCRDDRCWLSDAPQVELCDMARASMWEEIGKIQRLNVPNQTRRMITDTLYRSMVE